MSNDEHMESKNLTAILCLISSETDRQLAEQARSAGALTNRAALLVTSALIFTSIPKDGDGNIWWYRSALLCGVLAAICGVIALFFRTSIQEVKLSSLERQLKSATEIDAIRALSAQKQTKLNKARDHTQSVKQITLLGFVLLALSLTYTAFYLGMEDCSEQCTQQ